ncbi:MAG: hypothetical protein NT091_00215, partial [Candidatus Falkowbacteria bacterium]|nr:hypothetical protein [Candidatus Falkowbacteria bacterium]
WIACGVEADVFDKTSSSSECSFTGSRDVRFGAFGQYLYKKAKKTIVCNGTEFDGNDPIVLTRKYCAYTSAIPKTVIVLAGNPTTASYNASTTITWDTANTLDGSCTVSISIKGGSLPETPDWTGPQIDSGSYVVNNITKQRTYAITCTGIDGKVKTQKLTIGVGPAPEPTMEFSMEKLDTGKAKFKWNVVGAQTGACVASVTGGIWAGPKADSGEEIVSGLPNTKREYFLNCKKKDSSSYGFYKRIVTNVNAIPAGFIAVPNSFLNANYIPMPVVAESVPAPVTAPITPPVASSTP